MSYQVLARKWRPNSFSELVGQEHVVSAISNALDNDRLHHAYLFTGTRGVGKTTIARIFSKSLNCEQGLGSKPCGQCSTCVEIDQGRFVDLLEIDAASRTKVEDTRELLDNVQYRPTRGRYKVYLIDEVHMLSKHSFNALLKTLEEPPPHVKFLLATTDPQKLPVTILSRCLQFNLKALSRTQISQQLAHVLSQESIPHEQEALSHLSRAAQGSMRDALSLTDQAIAQGNGHVTLQVVTDMLGLMDKNQILKILHAVLQKDSRSVMQQVEQLSFQAPDYSTVLAELMSLLHQVALTQFVPDACKLETIAARAIYQLAKSVSAEQVQLLYQITLQGKKDLPFASDGRSGLEMTLLRMLAFSPDNIVLSSDDIAADMPAARPVESSVQTPIEVMAVETALSDVPPEVAPAAAASVESPPVVKNDEYPPLADYDNMPTGNESECGAEDSHQYMHDMYNKGQVEHEPPQGNRQTPSDNAPAPGTSSTESLLALHRKLESNKARLAEAQQVGKGPDPVKKPESETLAIPALGQSAPKPEQAPAEPQVAEKSEEAPPWDTDERPISQPVESILEPALEVFDSSAHLDEQIDVPVNLEIPVFLPDQQKVVAAEQLDDWSRLIEQINVTALTKQLALHSSFSQQGENIQLTLLESKQHLLSDLAQQQLQQALSQTLQHPVNLSIVLGEPENTPFAVQLKINHVRQRHAEQVVAQDPAFELIKSTFATQVVEDSIKPR